MARTYDGGAGTVGVTIEYSEKLPYKEAVRVYGQIKASPTFGRKVDAKDLELKTIRVVQLTPQTDLSVAFGGSVSIAGSVIASGSRDNYFMINATNNGSIAGTANFHFMVLGE